MGERVDGAAEITDTEEKQIGMLFRDPDRIQDLICKMPGGGSFPGRHETVGRNDGHSHAREFFPDRLRRLGGEGIVAVAGEKDGWFARRDGRIKRLFSEITECALCICLGFHCGHPCAGSQLASDSQLSHRQIDQG